MLTMKDFDQIMEGLDKTNESISVTEEVKRIQSRGAEFMFDITEILNTVSMELILIMKTNDLLRSLEFKYNCRTGIDTYIKMSESCLKALRFMTTQKMKVSFKNFFKYARKRVEQDVVLFLMFCYRLTLKP